MSQIHTIASYAKLQPDTLTAIFLLKKFGEHTFPGINAAHLIFWTDLPPGKSAEQLEQEGYLLIDLGSGRFDHHVETEENGKPKYCASEIVAKTLGLSEHPALQKLLAYARRDDLEGKGTLSEDPLDRAFGLSGLLVNLNRTFSHDLSSVAHMILAMFEAHYQEEENRTVVVKQEWKEAEEQQKAFIWTIHHKGNALKAVQLTTDNQSMAGFLRSYHRFDILALRRTSGHVNIITNQNKRIDLSNVAAALRAAEAEKQGIPTEGLTLTQPGRLPQIPQWFYDTVATTVQNGGLQPQDTPPTQLSDEAIKSALEKGLFTGQNPQFLHELHG